MRVIDFHLHINPIADVNRELRILDNDFENSIKKLSLKLRRTKVDKGMVVILDTRFLSDGQSVQNFKKLISSQELNNLAFTIMVDFRKASAPDVIKRAASLGIRGIKFHSIHQKITPSDYKRIKEIALLAESKNLILVIDTHYVGFECDDYSGLKLAKFLLSYVRNPVVLAHSGGLKVLEALVLALDYKNVYLDISFSIPFWIGTSIEEDFVFAIRKLGTKRFLYGSDTPFIDLNLAKKSVEKFLIKHKFSVKEREDIFYNTANSLLREKEQK